VGSGSKRRSERTGGCQKASLDRLTKRGNNCNQASSRTLGIWREEKSPRTTTTEKLLRQEEKEDREKNETVPEIGGVQGRTRSASGERERSLFCPKDSRAMRKRGHHEGKKKPRKKKRILPELVTGAHKLGEATPKRPSGKMRRKRWVGGFGAQLG